MRTTLTATGLLLTTALIGYLGYSAYQFNYAYTQKKVALERLQGQLLSAPVWRYGTLTSIDPDESNVQVTLSSGLSVRVFVASDTYVARQDLILEDGIYTGVLAPLQATFADLQVGQHVAVGLTKDAHGIFVASMILFGNPI